MQSQPEKEKRVKDEVLESVITEVGNEAEALPAHRNKRPARCYFMSIAVIYLMLLIVAVVVLASFEIKENELRGLKNSLVIIDKSQTCILFAPHIDVPEAGHRVITALKPPGLCGFVLWGLISITIVAFVWLIYNVVLAAIGPKIISVLRFLDLVMMVLTALLSFSLSVTITAGLNATCSKSGEYKQCADLLYYKHEGDSLPDTLEYYKEINIAQWSSWATTFFLVAISIWYFITVISYCCAASRRRNMARQYVHFEENAQDMPATV